MLEYKYKSKTHVEILKFKETKLFLWFKVCHPRCAFKLYVEVSSVKKHNYNI